MLFQAVMTFLSRLVEFKILVNWGMVHFDVSPDEGASLETSKFSLYFSGIVASLTTKASCLEKYF